MRPDATDLEQLSRRQENFHEFDLVVVDWDLDGEEKGDEVARRVRRRFGFTNIVFYSGKKPDELRDKVKEKAIDGVYCVHRRDLIQRLTELIDDIVAGLSRLDAMRGLAISTVSQCDGRLKDLIRSIFDSADGERKKVILDSLDEMVGESQSKGKERYGKCESLEDRLSSFSVTSFHLWKLALYLTKGNKLIVDQREILKRYDPEVLTTRNALGHAVERMTDDGWEIDLPGGNRVTRADFPALRGHFVSHRDNIAYLSDVFVANRAEKPD